MAVDEAEALAGFRPIRAVELAFVRGREKGPSAIAPVGWMPSGHDRQDYLDGMRERLAGLIGRIRTLTEEETYRPSPSANCRYCEFQSMCSLWPEGAPVFPVGEPVSPVATPGEEGP